MPVSLPRRVATLIDKLCDGLIEREQHLKLMLLAALAGEHVLLIGPPGTAKSLLARRLRLAFRAATFFERLLTQFSVPEDLFGPYSLEDLDTGRYRRLTEGYLADSDVGFLDEIFKANPSILNALLTLLNERVFHNVLPEGDAKKPTTKAPQPLPVPLKCLVGASNEVPPPGELDALYDRFLIRCEVGPVDDFLALLQSGSEDEPKIAAGLAFSSSELDAIRKAARSITVPDQVDELLVLLRQRVAEVQLDVSDRRWLKIRKLLQAAAHLDGRKAVSPLDLLMVPHCVWSPRQDTPQLQPVGNKDDGQKAQPQPVEVRDRLTEWLQERLWDPTPSKPGLLGDHVAAWEQKLQAIAKQSATERDPGAIASGVRETQSLVQRTTAAVQTLMAETKSLDASAVLKAAQSSGAKSRTCADQCVSTTRWLPPVDTLSALRGLDATLQQVSECKDRSSSALKSFQQFQKATGTENSPKVHAPGTSKKTSRKKAAPVRSGKSKATDDATERKPVDDAPPPDCFGFSQREAEEEALKAQQEWAAYLSRHSALQSSTRDVTQTFHENAYDKDVNPWTMEFKLIPPGEFTNADGTNYTIGQPFLLATFPVTQIQWAYAMGLKYNSIHWGNHYPINSKTWAEFAEFCNRLSQIQNLTPAYRDTGRYYRGTRSCHVYELDSTSNGYRLPSEAEWEYACRAGTNTKWWSGNDVSSLKNVAYFERYGRRAHPECVDRYRGNPFGLVGMHGNVWEWCEDEAKVRNEKAIHRVIRGGCHHNGPEQLMSSYRDSREWTNPGSTVGCRVARTIILDS